MNTFFKNKLLLTLSAALVLSTSISSESQAETWDCGKTANTVQCTYDESTKTLTVSGSGSMKNYTFVDIDEKHTLTAPWYNKEVENVVIGDNITKIGVLAFAFNDNLKSVSGMKDVEIIGKSAFNQSHNLQNFTMPENIKEIEGNAFQNITALSGKTFEIPSSLTTVGIDSLKFDGTFIISDDIDTTGWHNEVFTWHSPIFVCKGDINTCESKIAKFIKKSENGIGTCESERCLDDSAYTLVEANSEQCTGAYIYDTTCRKRNEWECNDTEKYYYNGATCVYRPKNGKITCLGNSHKENDGYCDRIRYTPAEAAAVLHDDNTNSVTITFKK